MHIDLKQTLACFTLLLAVSGCQSGAGSSSWKWWGAQKDQSVSPSELAGSPYDGVELPSAQVELPKVADGQSAPKKKTLATIPPGTPTPNAYSVTGAPAKTPAKRSGTPTYPSTSYPSTPYTNPQSTAAGGVANAPVPSAPNPGTSGPAKPRYSVTEFAAGSPQPRYPNTGYGATPAAPPSSTLPRAHASQGLAAESYDVKPVAGGNTGFNPGASGLGPRYSSNGNAFAGGAPPNPQPVVPPVNTKFSGNSASPTQNTIGPRYATLPTNPAAPRYDARPAPPIGGGEPPASPTNLPYADASPGVGSQKIVQQPAGRYPQAIVPTTPDSAGSRQVDFTPFQPGSTGRYEPESTQVALPPTAGGNTFQPGTPYNPPATERP